MCGGRGTRLDSPVEKPLFEIGGTPMIDRVLAALRGSEIDTVHAVVSPYTPDTREHVRDAGVSTIDAPGEGYVADLNDALDRVDRPVLTTAADLPLLADGCVNAVLDAYNGGSMTVCVPAALKDALGVSADTTFEADGGDGGPGRRSLAPTGVNVVGARDEADHVHVSWDARLAVNVNRPADVRVAEALLRGRPE